MEEEYIANRHSVIPPYFQNITKRLGFTREDVNPPTIAIAISGGGLRSMLTGAGVLSAYDIASPEAEDELGGILQTSSYIAGISGGLWIVMNNLLNNGEPVVKGIQRLKADLQNPILEGVPNMELNELRHSVDSKQNKNVTSQAPEAPKILASILPSVVSSLFSKSQDESSFNVKSVFKFYKDISLEAHPKKEAGFRLSLIDYWARTLSRKVFPASFRSTGYTMSSTSKLLSFQNYSQPFPIITSVEVVPGKTEDSSSSHVIEVTPFEFGSWDSFLGAFTNIKYLGTKAVDGVPSRQEHNRFNYSVCTSGFDSLAFLTATSSGLFNTVFQYIYKLLPDLTDELTPYFAQLLGIFGFGKKPVLDQNANSEYAIYSPNPFFGYRIDHHRGRSIADDTAIYLADGGEDGQNIPFSPFMVPSRKVDAILAFDVGSEIYNRPNGSSLRASARRYHANTSDIRIPLFQDREGALRRVFPAIPSVEEFLSLGFHERPVFFGCNMADYPLHTGNILDQFDLQARFTPPLIVYQANHDVLFPSNTSTFRTTYSPEEVQGMTDNGYGLALHAEDPNYKNCLWYALVKRTMSKLPLFCVACFDKYCYKPPGL